MKTKNIIFISGIFLTLFIFGMVLIVMHNTSMSAAEIYAEIFPENNRTLDLSKCSNNKKIADISKTTETHLVKLNEYQEVCDSYVTDTMMIFMDMPKDTEEARKKAEDLSVTLKEFNKYGVTPIVIVEPVTTWGLVDFEEFDTGFYDKWLNEFFEALVVYGVKTEMMGTWVPFPEANLPYWNRANATPEQFGLVVNRYLRIMKKYYPKAEGSVLLNSATYESTDFSWENGEYVSLVPYVALLDKSLVSSFGIQGFPWRSNATYEEPTTLYDAGEFINPELAIEAANALGVKDIWINTGTFSSKYTLESEKIVFIDSSTRQAIADDIVKQAVSIKEKGYTVSVNLFSEDKSETPEATNWSYWGDYKNTEDPNRYIFKDMAKKLEDRKIDLWLFDSNKLSEYDANRELR